MLPSTPGPQGRRIRACSPWPRSCDQRRTSPTCVYVRGSSFGVLGLRGPAEAASSGSSRRASRAPLTRRTADRPECSPAFAAREPSRDEALVGVGRDADLHADPAPGHVAPASAAPQRAPEPDDADDADARAVANRLDERELPHPQDVAVARMAAEAELLERE